MPYRGRLGGHAANSILVMQCCFDVYIFKKRKAQSLFALRFLKKLWVGNSRGIQRNRGLRQSATFQHSTRVERNQRLRQNDALKI